MEIKKLYRVACTFLNNNITCFLNSSQYVKWHNWVGDKHEVDLSNSIKFHSQSSACSKLMYLHCTVIWKVYLMSSSSKCKIFPSVTHVLSCRVVTHPGKSHLQRDFSYWKTPVGLEHFTFETSKVPLCITRALKTPSPSHYFSPLSKNSWFLSLYGCFDL